MDIRVASAGEIGAVQDLWREYWLSLGLPGDFQHFEEECAALPGEYGPPRGRLLLARISGDPAGTAAFRPLNDQACEFKRLYMRPQYRGAGLGKALLHQLLAEARTLDYKEIYCDTLKSMTSALRMYERMGFVQVEAYADHPTPNAVFFRLSL